MSHQIKVATRVGTKLLIGLYAESGCGKTYTSLVLARGLVGAKGRIIMVDSESGRGSLYADEPEIGGYEVLELEQPFAPSRYIEAIDACEEAKADAIIIDSMSHEWEGIGGVIDMAGENEARNGKTLNNWNKPKIEHAKLLGRLLRTRAHVICCIRAKYKTRQKNGKVERDDYISPIQAEDFIFEMTIHAEILPNHAAFITKAHKTMVPFLPQGKETPLSKAHGESLAKWCSGGGKQSAPAKDDRVSRLLNELEPYGTASLTEYAVFKGIIQPGQSLRDWPLAKVPSTKGELRSLMGDIETWKEGVAA